MGKRENLSNFLATPHSSASQVGNFNKTFLQLGECEDVFGLPLEEKISFFHFHFKKI